MNTLADEVRWSTDIGMWTVDRSIPISCIHKTDYCAEFCYNEKLYKLYPAMRGKDERNETAWHSIEPEAVDRLRAKFKRCKTKQYDRARLMSRGEAFKDYADVDRVCQLLARTPETTWWIPTRAWRNPILWTYIKSALQRFDNYALLASLDPSNNDEEREWLEINGDSTMYFGDNDDTGGRFKCPKTWGNVKGACAVCKNGCFKPSVKGEQVHVHLKKH